MGWSEKRSRERIAGYVEDAKGTEVKPMVREMALENLSEKVCREIEGAHVYIELDGVPKLFDDTGTLTERKRLMQAVHIFQRELDRIVYAVGATHIHFQASRGHALVYLPINQIEEHAKRAVLAQLIADRFERVFRDAYPQFDSLRVISGSDRGLAIGTRNGTAGDRELTAALLDSPAHRQRLRQPADLFGRAGNRGRSRGIFAGEALDGGIRGDPRGVRDRLVRRGVSGSCCGRQASVPVVGDRVQRSQGQD